MVIALRKPETQDKYDKHKMTEAFMQKCVLCHASSLQDFRFWKIIKNDFPYDVITDVHHMLVPVRHSIEPDLTDEEREEFREIKNSYLEMHYGGMYENMHGGQTIPAHMHIHLFVFKTSL